MFNINRSKSSRPCGKEINQSNRDMHIYAAKEAIIEISPTLCMIVLSVPLMKIVERQVI